MWDFYADMRAESSFKPSHNGQYVAWRATRKTKQVVLVKNQNTRQEEMRIEDVHSYFWSPHSTVLQIGRKGRLWRVDPAQPIEDNWRDITPRGFKGGQIKVRHRPAMICLLSHQVTATRPFQISTPPAKTAAIKRSSLKTKGKRLDGCWARI